MSRWGFLGDDVAATDPADAKAADNVLRLYDYTHEIIKAALRGGEKAPLTPEIIREMNALALDGLDERAGKYRDDSNRIANSRHVPPPWEQCPQLVEEMCDLLRAEAHAAPTLWHASFALWRLNWIHPFADGNGRTARSTCQVELSVMLEMELLPGRVALPDRILNEKRRYWRCLEAADEAYKSHHFRRNRGKRPNVSQMEGFLGRLLRELLEEDERR